MQSVDDYGVWSRFAGQLCLAWHPLDKDFPMERAQLQVERYDPGFYRPCRGLMIRAARWTVVPLRCTL
jgi:hypothetical protein